MARILRPLRPLAGGLLLLCGTALLPGCGGGEAPTPPMGSAEFEAAKKEYQEIRASERGLKTFNPRAKAKGGKAKS